MKSINQILIALGLATACFVGASSSAYAVVAGHVQFVSGNVQIISPTGQARMAQKGDAVNEGDTLTSAAKSTAQIKMQDGGFFAVRPDTRMKFDKFVFAGEADGNERGFFSLFKGGFRAVTGLIGRVNKQNYKVSTPAATIGIRGTDYEVVFVESKPVNVAAATMLMTQVDFVDADSMLLAQVAPGGGNQMAAAVVNTGAIAMQTDVGSSLLQAGTGKMVVSFGINQQPFQTKIDVDLFPGAGKPGPTGAGQPTKNGEDVTGNGEGTGEGDGATGKGDGATGEGDGATGEGDGATGEGDGATGEGGGATGEGGGATGEGGGATGEGGGATGEGGGATGEGAAAGGGGATADAGTATGGASTGSSTTTGGTTDTTIRSTAVVDATPPVTGGVPAVSTTPVTPTTVSTVIAPTASTQTVLSTTTVAGGTTANLTTGTATTSTGQTVPITQSLVATQAQAAATAAAAAAQAAATAATAVATADTTLAGIAQIPLSPAMIAISMATTDVTNADSVVITASALMPADAATAAANAASLQTATTAAVAQANAAQAALTGNGVFADSTAVTANTLVQAANTTLQTANTDVQTAAAMVSTQNTALTTAQTAATTALASANANLSTANTELAAASTQNAAITSAQAAMPALVTAAQTALANAQLAAASAQLAADEAAIFQAAGDLVNAQAQLLIAQQELAFAQQQLVLAQTAQTDAAAQLASAQTAQTAAQTAVSSASLAASSASLDATTAGAEATTAQTAATNAAAAFAQTDPAVVSPTLSPAHVAVANADVIALNAPVAAYNNPAVVTTDRFIGLMSTVQQDTVGGSGYIEGYGPGGSFTGIGEANTSFVLDGAGNLVEKRHAWYEETPASSATPQIVVVDANVKRTGGVAAETFKMADNSIYAGRWVGGTITVSDNVVGIPPIPTFTRDLGVTSEHWAILLAPPVGYVQTLGGIVAYNKVAATSPTDALGNVGVLNTATLSANFTSQLVDAALNLTIAGKTFDVSALGMAINSSFFSTATQVTTNCTGCAGTYYANVGGGFAGDGAASAGLNYTLWSGAAPGSTAGATDLIQGMAAFTAATTPTVAPPVTTQAFVQTDVSFELSIGNGYNQVGLYNTGALTAATNVAPTAATPSFGWNYGCVGCGSYAVSLPGATGAVNGNAITFATTGIQFGRWTDVPTISQTSTAIAFGPGKNSGYGPSSWAFAPEGYLDTPTTLSAATGGAAVGVFTYALNGAPAPKDSSGATGTLNSLSLTADFTTQTVTAAMSVSLGATTWSANSAAPMGIGAFNGVSAGFGGSLTVTSSNASVTTSGYLEGSFTGQNYAGMIVDYAIQEWLTADGTMTANLGGVAALTRNNVAGNATVVDALPSASGKFVVAEAGSYGMRIQQTVDTATTTGGVLTSYGHNAGTGNTSTTTINCVTCTGQFAADLATGIQFGTWDEGTRTYGYTMPFGGQAHWISGPGLDPIYLPEVLLGNMSYTLDGGTAPTNQSGVAGTLSGASLTVNFTNQTVDVALGLTGVNGHNWTANATSMPLEWTNYSKNTFRANTGDLATNNLIVTMDGATVGTGNLIGQLTGSGLNGALFQYQLSAPTAMPTVPNTFASADMVAVQAPSVTVTGPVVTGDTVSIAFPAGDPNATLSVMPATTLNLTLAAGMPVAATLSGGITASVASLTPDAFMSTYSGLASSGETFSMDLYGGQYSARYSNFGEWRLLPTPMGLAPATATGPFSSGEFAGGMLMTPVTSMPVSNFAVSGYYYGAMVGGAQDSLTNTPYTLLGNLDLFANFTTGMLSGSATSIQVVDRTTGGFVGYFNDLTLDTAISTNTFSGSVMAGTVPAGLTASPVNVAAGALGATSGHFYGPQANELTGAWQMVNGTIKASGAFGAGNGTSNSMPLETVNGVVALVASAPADTATAYRLVAMSAYDPGNTLNSGMVLEGGYNNATRIAEVAGGVTAFDSGYSANNIYTYTGSSRFAIGTAIQSDLGTDVTTGISWGRWVGGSIDVADRATGTVTPTALGLASMHWLATPSMTGPVALPVSGVYNYVLAGGTAPTDNLGNVGTLNSATLVANFTAQTVDVGVNVGINAMTLSASGTGIPIQQRSMFDAGTSTLATGGATLTAACAGTGCVGTTQAGISGAFTGASGNGAGMIYGFSNGGTVVNGVAAFQQGAQIPQ